MDPLLAAALGVGAGLLAKRVLRPGRFLRFSFTGPPGEPGPPGPVGPRGRSASELESPEVNGEGEHLNLWDGLLQAARRDVSDVSRQLHSRVGNLESRWLGTLASHCGDAKAIQDAFQMALSDEWMETRNGLEEWRKALVEDQLTWREEVDATLAETGNWRQELVDRLAAEGEELDATVRCGLEEFEAWKKGAIQVEAMQEQVASLTETIQQMTPWANEMASRVESHGGGVIEVARRVQELANKVELMEEIVGALAPRQPATPLGPLPVGGDLGAEAAELISRGNELRNVFLQRAAARGQAPGGQRPVADPRQVRPAL